MSRWLSGARGVAVVVAHPDDETWGLGSRLEWLAHARFVYTTDGAPPDGADAARSGFPSVDAYRDARRHELRAALADADVAWDRVLELGIPDQSAMNHVPWLVAELACLFRREPIEVVLTHAYEGGHPDHDATAMAVHLAAREVACGPHVVEMGGYRRGPGDRPATTFLPRPDAGPEEVIPLTPDALARRERRLAMFGSQRDVLRWLGSVRCERLRRAPRYDFAEPPHDGPLLYESFGWRVRGVDFRRRTRRALEEVGG